MDSSLNLYYRSFHHRPTYFHHILLSLLPENFSNFLALFNSISLREILWVDVAISYPLFLTWEFHDFLAFLFVVCC